MRIHGKQFELEGHLDTIVLAGDGPAPAQPLTVSCTLGKYLGPRFGVTIWTRRSTRCADRGCPQCAAVFMPNINFRAVPKVLRWQQFEMFPQVEYDDRRDSSVVAAAVAGVHGVIWTPEIAQKLWREVDAFQSST